MASSEASLDPDELRGHAVLAVVPRPAVLVVDRAVLPAVLSPVAHRPAVLSGYLDQTVEGYVAVLRDAGSGAGRGCPAVPVVWAVSVVSVVPVVVAVVVVVVELVVPVVSVVVAVVVVELVVVPGA